MSLEEEQKEPSKVEELLVIRRMTSEQRTMDAIPDAESSGLGT